MKFSGLFLIAVTGISLTLSGYPSASGSPTSADVLQEVSSPDVPLGTGAVLTVSRRSADYAQSIGGTDHEGETLYFIIGASVRTEAAAQKGLDRAIPLFGDMQSYFIVQRSDSFRGMKSGWWLVVEAYHKFPSQENVDFARRAFPDAYVKRATVAVSAPIPVYEDLVDGQ